MELDGIESACDGRGRDKGSGAEIAEELEYVKEQAEARSTWGAGQNRGNEVQRVPR
jgi:hypothetical protein